MLLRSLIPLGASARLGRDSIRVRRYDFDAAPALGVVGSAALGFSAVAMLGAMLGAASLLGVL